jgi:hypothetical protein
MKTTPTIHKLQCLALFFLLCTSPFLNAQVPAWIWSKSVGGSGVYDPPRAENCFACTYTLNGSVVVAGFFESDIIHFGSTTLVNSVASTLISGTPDIYLAKYDVAGNVLWARRAGGILGDLTYTVCSDPYGNIYIAGDFNSPALVFYDSIQNDTLFNPQEDARSFIAKYDASGNVLWCRAATNVSGESYVRSVSADNSGNVFITGNFTSSTLTFGNIALTNAGNSNTPDVFIAKYDTWGNVLWAKRAGGIHFEECRGVCTDPGGNAIVCGNFEGTSMNFDNITLTNTNFQNEIFVVKYDPQGNVLWAHTASGNSRDEAKAICCDNNGNVFITGQFSSPYLTFGSYFVTNFNNSGNIFDMYVAKYDAAGNVMWARSAGGSSNEQGNGICCDANGNVYVIGNSMSPAIVFGPNATFYNSGTGNTQDVFVVQYDATANVVWQKGVGSSSDDYGFGICSDIPGNLRVTGVFKSASITFDQVHNNTGTNFDVFIGALDNINGVAEESDVSAVSVFPNPFNASFEVHCQDKNEALEIDLFDLSGKEVLRNVFVAGSGIIEAGELADGVYIYCVRDSLGEIVGRGKVIKQDGIGN